MIKEGFKPEKLFTIHNSLAYDQQLAVRKEMKKTSVYTGYFGNDNPNLFFVGRLTPVKKLDQILRAMVICKQNGHEYNMTFIGGGEKTEERQESQIRQAGPESHQLCVGRQGGVPGVPHRRHG